MKKILAVFLLTLSVASIADARCCYRGGYYGGGGWVAPALIGGVIGYELAQPRTVIVEPPLYTVPPVQYVPTPSAPIGYHYEQVTVPSCNCIQSVLVQNR